MATDQASAGVPADDRLATVAIAGAPSGGTRALQSAHSETLGAGAKMPVREQRQVSTKVVTRAGYNCSVTAAPVAAPL